MKRKFDKKFYLVLSKRFFFSFKSFIVTMVIFMFRLDFFLEEMLEKIKEAEMILNNESIQKQTTKK